MNFLTLVGHCALRPEIIGLFYEGLVAGGGFELPTFDFIKSSASSDLSKLGSANDQGLGRKEAEHVDYRLRLSPERTANRMGRYGNWRVRRAAADTQRWGGRAVLPRAEEKRNQRARIGSRV